jgi:hypothetical protein
LDLLLETGARLIAGVLRNLEGRIEYRWDGISGLDLKGNY